jgi:hypothetical protein
MPKRDKRKGRRANATGRNETEQYLPISYAMAQSPAWRSLSGAALKVWVELRCRFNGRNNGQLSLSWDEAARLLGLGKGTVGHAFAELQEKGFIVMTKRGQWYGRLATTWAVTDKSYQGHAPSRAWNHWKPPAKKVRAWEKNKVSVSRRTIFIA